MDNIILVTAIINVVAVLAIFVSCRFVPGLNLTKPVTKWRWFRYLYKNHSYVWWLLAPSFLVHASLATLHRIAGG
jgi:hypothetical protein